MNPANFEQGLVSIVMLPRGPIDCLTLQADRRLRAARLWIVDPELAACEAYRVLAAELGTETVPLDGLLGKTGSEALQRIRDVSGAGESAAILLDEKKHGPTLVSIVAEQLARYGCPSQWVPCVPSHQISLAREKLPLSGLRILVTRPRRQAAEFCRLLWECGAIVEVQPAIELLPTNDHADLDRALGQLDAIDWIVFSSSNGVEYLLERLFALGWDLRALGGLRIAAIGPGTARKLRMYGLVADLVPEAYRAEALADRLTGSATGKRFLLARASRGRDVLAERLTAAGADVRQIVVYSSVDVKRPDPRVETLLLDGRIDWVTVTSSAIARSLADMFGPGLRKSRLAAISPLTAQALRDKGLEPTAVAEQYDMPGLVRAICHAAEADA